MSESRLLPSFNVIWHFDKDTSCMRRIQIANMSRFHQLFPNNENNFRNGQWQHSWLSPFTSQRTQPAPHLIPITSLTLALTCTNFDFSSLTHLTRVCGILIGLRAAGESPARVRRVAAQQSEPRAVTLWCVATFPSCNRIYGISEVPRGAGAAVFRLDRFAGAHCRAWPCPLMTRHRESARVQWKVPSGERKGS